MYPAACKMAILFKSESRPAEHVEHLVATDSQERSSHTLDVSRVDPSKPDQQLRLAHHLVRPLLLVEVRPKGVSDCVGSNLVTIGIEVLHLGVVRPLVGHVEGGLHGAAVRVVAVLEQIFVKLLVEIVDGVIEGEQDELRYLVGRKSSRDISAATVAILENKTCNLTGGASIQNYRNIGAKITFLSVFFRDELTLLLAMLYQSKVYLIICSKNRSVYTI